MALPTSTSSKEYVSQWLKWYKSGKFQSLQGSHDGEELLALNEQQCTKLLQGDQALGIGLCNALKPSRGISLLSFYLLFSSLASSFLIAPSRLSLLGALSCFRCESRW